MNKNKIALNFYTYVQNTKKPNAENPNIRFDLNAAGTRYVELRRSGGSDYDFSAVFCDNESTVYNHIVKNDGTFIAGRILSIQEITLSSAEEKKNGETWELSAGFSSVTGAKSYLLIPKQATYGIFYDLSYSGNTLSAKLRNISGETHTLGAKVYVVALNI